MAQGSIHTAKRTRNGNLTSPKVKVAVTQEVIDQSCKRDSSHCMVAEAVKEAIPNAQYVSVDLATIRFTDMEAGMRYIYLTPRKAQTAILDFDQGIETEPFSFIIQGAHIMPTGSARKAKATLQPENKGGTKPTRIGGVSAPIGPLAGGVAPASGHKGGNRGAGAGNRTGKRREFGLRQIIK